ncbi:hypothetical protein EDD15DRAFT_2365995 [Pisolithus albus]|nr:hypothetical protein EDD15DRAFT_2365995 [Pisolithus albus]
MAEGAVLRDESGRLDLEKIWCVFEGQNHAVSKEGLRLQRYSRRVGKRVLDSFGGPAQTDVVSRRDHPAGRGHGYLENESVTSTIRNSRPDRSGYPDVDGALNDTLGGARDEVRTLPRLYDELRKVRLEKGKELKASERRSTQVLSRAQDSKICRDAIAPSDLRVPAPTVQDGSEVGPQVAIGRRSEYGPKHDGDGALL